MKPYTYYIYHPKTNSHYYGVRFAKNCSPSELWKTYFTSSKKVKRLIELHGKNSFICEVRKIFDTKKDAILWEEKVLRRLKVLNKPHWLNQNINGAIQYDVHPKGMLGKKHTEKVREEIRRRTKGKTYEELYGEEKATSLRKDRSLKLKGKISKLKNRTYEEIHGLEKAKKLKEDKRKRKGCKLLNFKAPQKRECPHCKKLYDPGNLSKHLSRLTNQGVIF